MNISITSNKGIMPFAIQKSINERSKLAALSDDVKQAYKYYKMVLKNSDAFPVDYPEKCKNEVVKQFNAYRKQRKILDNYMDEKTLKNDKLVENIKL
jgi:hypothetical protein